MPSSPPLAPPTPAEASLRVVPTQARGREKLARLLDAADRILATEGVDALTTGHIATEADVSVGSLYRYLPHREAIIEALAMRYLEMIEARMDEFVRADSLPADPVGVGVAMFAAFYREHPGFRALWFSRHLTEQTRALDRAHKLTMALRMRELLVRLGAPADDATLRLARTVQLAADAVLQEAFRIDPDGDAELLAQLTIMITSYLAAAAS